MKKKELATTSGNPGHNPGNTGPSPSAGTRLHFNAKVVGWIAGMLGIALFFLIFKMFNLNFYAGDEAIYISQGRFISEGLLPYKDFSMAHPPLQSLLIAAIIKFIGYDTILFRMIPVFWSLMAAFLLAVIVRKELGVLASLAAMSLYLLSYEPMRASIHFTGVNMTIALLMFALLAQRNRNMLACAVFCVLSAYTRLYALPVVLSLFIFTWFQDKKEAYKLAAYGLTMGIAVFVMIGIWTGFGAFAEDVFLFQAQKTAMRMEQVAFMRDAVLFHNAVALILFSLGTISAFVFSAASRKQGDSGKKIKKSKNSDLAQVHPLIWYSIGSVVLMLMILLNLKRVWMYYYVLAFPFAAIAGGWMFSLWTRYLMQLLKKSKQGRQEWEGRSPWMIVSFIIFIVFYFSSGNLEKRLDYYKEAMRNPAKKTATYEWIDGKLPSWLNLCVKNMFWKDTRIIGNSYSSFTYYLWHSSRTLDIAEAIVSDVLSRTTEKDFIFGDSGTVPLISLLADREIAGYEADTNIEQFRSGNINATELVQRINIPSTKLIILRDKFGVANVPEVQRMVSLNYKEVKSFTSKTGFTIRIFERMPA